MHVAPKLHSGTFLHVGQYNWVLLSPLLNQSSTESQVAFSLFPCRPASAMTSRMHCIKPRGTILRTDQHALHALPTALEAQAQGSRIQSRSGFGSRGGSTPVQSHQLPSKCNDTEVLGDRGTGVGLPEARDVPHGLPGSAVHPTLDAEQGI